MRSPSPWLLVCGAAAGLLVAACREKEAAAKPAPAPATQGVEGFFNPQAREIWTYAGTRDFPPGTRFGPDTEQQVLDLPGGAKRLEFERRRICTGLYRPEEADRDLTTFDVYENGELLEHELYDITPDGVIGRGWARANVPLAKGVLLTPGIKIAAMGMVGGQSWDVPTEDPDRSFRLDVIERTDITVPAGTFEAARLRITVRSNERSTKRTVWFAENVGIVKEEVVHYDADHIRVRERLELVQWMLPTLAHREDAAGPNPPPPSPPGGYTRVSLTAPPEEPPAEDESKPAEDDPKPAEDEPGAPPDEGALPAPPEGPGEEPGDGPAGNEAEPGTDQADQAGPKAKSAAEDAAETDRDVAE